MLSCATGFHTSAWALHRPGDDKVQIRPLQKLEAHRVASLAAEHRNYYRLPRVRGLTVLNESAEVWYWNGPASPATRTRALERLTINGEYWPDIISIYAGNLRQLSLNLTSRLTGEAQAQGSLAWDEAWKMLRAFTDHLEYLDLYHSSATIMSSAPDLFDDSPLSEEDTEVTPFCPPLTEFTKVRQLYITPLGLAGYQCAHPTGCKFRNHLPTKLESIGFYTDPGDWAREHFSTLDKELEGIALEGSRNGGRLRAVVVCDSPHAGNIETAKLQAACTANGIFYSDDGSKYLFYCGNETVWGDLYHWVRGGDRERRFEDRDPGRVIPWGMEVNDIPGRPRGELRFGF
ncbi:hypothetical protein BJX66DRAFT_344019 [Aspergillus keveii]|uniref:Uncharacterized protein n=1 Tax=Aspergillus keveii TaxID=714993 RepID=A0ABR4FMK2_9EURO